LCAVSEWHFLPVSGTTFGIAASFGRGAVVRNMHGGYDRDENRDRAGEAESPCGRDDDDQGDDHRNDRLLQRLLSLR
jgi:hypothetical protein